MLIYATSAELTTWGVAPPTNATTLLRSASILVHRATMTAVYDIDDTGMPTDPALVEALSDATCSQVGTWVALSIDPAKGAADPKKAVVLKRIGSATIQYDPAAAQALAAAATWPSQEALLILAQAGLLSTSPMELDGQLFYGTPPSHG